MPRPGQDGRDCEIDHAAILIKVKIQEALPGSAPTLPK